MSHFRSVRVRLEVDLTRYHSSLKSGVEGTTVPPTGLWARASDRFVGVRFPEVALDVLWSNLNIVDEEYLKEFAAIQAAQEEGIKLRTIKAVRYLGPKSGFRSLSVEYKDADGSPKSANIVARDEAARVRGWLEASGIAVETVRLK